MNVVAEGKKRKKNKITVYTEDNENILFVKAILKTKASILDFVDVTLPCSTLTELVNRDIPKIIKLKATTSLRISCLFCIFKHSPPKKRFDGQNGGN